MLSKFKRHSKELQAFAAIFTALLALAALIGVKVQIDSAAKIQREQSAKEIYREFLRLSIQYPQFAEPDFCNLTGSRQSVGYDNFVGFMLYTGEQVLETNPDWQPVVDDLFHTHSKAICSIDHINQYSQSVGSLISDFQATECQKLKRCQ